MNSTTSTTKTYTVDLGEQNKGVGEYGWICPVCGRGVAPTEKTCPCKGEEGWVHPVYPVYPIYPTYPTYPFHPWWYKTTCESGTSTNGETNG